MGVNPSTARSRMSRISNSTVSYIDSAGGGEGHRTGESRGNKMASWEFSHGETHPLGEPMFTHPTLG